MASLSKSRNMRVLRSGTIGCLAVALLCVTSNHEPLATAEETKAVPPSPFAAHNAYPWRLYVDRERFEKALASGMRHLEVDVSYDPQRKVVAVTHDTMPRGDEPELGALLEPLWKQWSSSGLTGYTLIIDLKTSAPELAAGILAVLERHRGEVSTLSKKPGSQFVERPITVCLTGSGGGHREFDKLVPPDGEYLAFADLGRSQWESDVAQYVPKDPPGFIRFLTFEQGAFRAAPSAKSELSVERMAELMRLADAGGYRVRIYTLNAKRSQGNPPDTTSWERCVQAKVHMIATDDYALAQEWWAERVAAQPAPKGP